MKELNLVKTSSTLAVVLMMIATAATPAFAGTTGQNDAAEDFIIETEHGFGKVTALMSLLFNNDSITVIRDLYSKGYELEFGETNIQRIRSKENSSHEALLIVIPAESKSSNNSAQVILTSNGKRTCVASAIIEDGADYRKIDVYEIDDGIEKNYVVLNRDGTISIDGGTILTGVQQIGSGQVKSGPVILAQVEPKGCGTGNCHWSSPQSKKCRMCRSVCNSISGVACGLSGYVVCLAACSCFAGPACGPICVVVYGLLCVYGGSKNCNTCCRMYC